MTYLSCKNDTINLLWKDYMDTRNLGLKKQANKLLLNIVKYINSLEENEIHDFVFYIGDLKYNKMENILIQFPLMKSIIFPRIFAKCKEHEMPYLRWLYQLEHIDNECSNEIYDYFDNGFSILELAHEIDENDLICVKLLIDAYFYSLWYGGHHFPDFILIEKSHVDELENKLKKLFEKYKDSALVTQDLIDDLSYYVNMYSDWFYYNDIIKGDDFAGWCISNNKNYSWVRSYYYSKKNRK